MKKISVLFILAVMSGIVTLTAYKLLFESESKASFSLATSSPTLTRNVGLSGEAIDFTEAAERTLNHVVHVKNVSYRRISNPIMEFFYGYGGEQRQQQVGTGSGVIISPDGYIVTNNHVIKDAEEIEVTLNNKKTYTAKLIGTDSKMDIAVIKVEADEVFPYAVFGDSDQVRVGEWVLAVGNPYNLNSTVTAGIISAKARNLDTNGIQSFIQTDAAVNTGNSGGALVNTRGDLIGINTMISSPTGSYAGYSFAVPSNVTKKIIEDIMEFGNVQRGILGVEGLELNGAVSKELNIKETQGFLIKKISKNSGAEKAGLKEGDIIMQLDNQKVTSFAELTGYVNTKRPNDKIQVTVIRDDKKVTLPVALSKKELVLHEIYGLEVEDLEPSELKKMRLNGGVKIKNITNELLSQYEEELQGSVLLSIDGVLAKDTETLSQLLSKKSKRDNVMVEILMKNGQRLRVIIPKS